MRESATQYLCETCVTFGGKGLKRDRKKKTKSLGGRATTGELYVTFMSVRILHVRYPSPHLDSKSRAGRYPSKELRN